MFNADTAQTQWVTIEGADYAYRRLGMPGSAPPLVMLTRYRGTIDHWDPKLLDALAASREVIIFDTRGTGLSTGVPPQSVEEMIEAFFAFVDALGLDRIDLLGWSMGGYVATGSVLARPGLVRRLILAGGSPGGAPHAPLPEVRVREAADRPVNTDEDFLLVYFPETSDGRAAGRESLSRVDVRLARSRAEVSPETVQAQQRALGSFAGYWEESRKIAIPVLAANGARDVLQAVEVSGAIAGQIERSKVIIYGDAGHGFLFQYIEDFASEVDLFLA
ncbi:alpha/beta fold hydrolase [Streptomyces sp. NPDC090080]|uniref:alpha/beta fold hydrolase n=1 Tax=Streptomyces sp. NPDC090080 TaxID=3365939 RepID=UPI00381242C3